MLRACPTGGHLAWFEVEWDESEIQNNDDPSSFRDEELCLGWLDCPLCGIQLDYHDLEYLGVQEVLETRTVES